VTSLMTEGCLHSIFGRTFPWRDWTSPRLHFTWPPST